VIELRWYTDKEGRRLQSRVQKLCSDYSAVDPKTHAYVQKLEWTEWKDVPEIVNSVEYYQAG
jgi:DNA-binding ferritin-like protein (Dps family)